MEEPFSRSQHGQDEGPDKGMMPDVVVFPQTTEEVSEVGPDGRLNLAAVAAVVGGLKLTPVRSFTDHLIRICLIGDERLDLN